MRIYISLVVIATIVLGAVLFIFQGETPQESASNQSNGGVQSYQLSNGMKVLVLESHRAPVVVSQVWYKVGGSSEHDGITGVSHVLEHMMFKGTPQHPSGEFSEIIAANGGKENAFTSKDYTAYFQRISSDKLAICIEMEADRMTNLLLDEDDFIKEVEVVKEERRLRTDDKPTALTFERFNAVAYTNNPYRQPIIGWMEDLDSMSIDDLRSWYRTWYAPNNATLVVVGDVVADEVFSLAKQHFGALSSVELPAIKPRHEVEQYGTQRISVQLPAKIPTLIMGYKTPVLKSAVLKKSVEKWEVYALEVLSGLLDGGDSARLTRNLVRGKQLVTSVGASYNPYALHDSLFVFSAIPAGDNAIDVLEFAIKEEIKAIQDNPPDQNELDRVIAQVVASTVYEQDSSFYQAMQIGILETVDLGWQTKDEYIEQVKAVTAEQVQQVAKKYLIAKNLTVAVLDPLPIEQNNGPASPRKSIAGGRHGQ
jgi:zinc protease